MGRGLDQTLFVQVREMRTIATIKILRNLNGSRQFLLVVFIASHDESIRDRQWSFRPTLAAIVDRDSRPNIVASVNSRGHAVDLIFLYMDQSMYGERDLIT